MFSRPQKRSRLKPYYQPEHYCLRQGWSAHCDRGKIGATGSWVFLGERKRGCSATPHDIWKTAEICFDIVCAIPCRCDRVHSNGVTLCSGVVQADRTKAGQGCTDFPGKSCNPTCPLQWLRLTGVSPSPESRKSLQRVSRESPGPLPALGPKSPKQSRNKTKIETKPIFLNFKDCFETASDLLDPLSGFDVNPDHKTLLTYNNSKINCKNYILDAWFLKKCPPLAEIWGH